jgi:hypothetical protein
VFTIEGADQNRTRAKSMKATPAPKTDLIEVLYKNSDAEVVKTLWSDLDSGAVIGGRPWRTFP